MTALVPAPGPGTVPARSTSPVSGQRPRVLRREWPLTALLVLYPLWWALGLGTLIVFFLPVPMTVALIRRRPVKVPPAFGLWLCFLLTMLLSKVMLGYNPPGVVPEPASHWIAPVLYTMAGYLAVTIMFLYVGNLSEEEYPRQRLIRQLGILFVVVVCGGWLGILAPTFQFRSPVEMLLPAHIAQNAFVQSLVHPTASQIQDVLGFQSPRPAAPFGYTNIWGDCLALLLGWFVISWLLKASWPRRMAGLLVLALAVVPIIYSLNRGLWVGLGLAIVFVGLRLVARGNVTAVAVLIVTVIAAAAVLAFSPLTTVIAERIAHPHSNSIRSFTVEKTVEATNHSPVIGLGITRAALGSSNSIAVGKSSSCPLCGNQTLGSTGQFWAVLISQGYVGALLYLGFFLRSMWIYRRDRSPIGDAGLLAIFLSLWFSLVYNALVMPLVLTFLSVALLWRNHQESAADDARALAAADSPARPSSQLAMITRALTARAETRSSG